MRGGLPTSADESQGGDGAAAIVVGSDADGPRDRRIPRALRRDRGVHRALARTRLRPVAAWEERFGEVKYAPLAEQAWNAALKAAELSPDQVDRADRHRHARAPCGRSQAGSASKAAVADDLAATVGNTGTAHAALLLTDTLRDVPSPGR